MTGGGYLSCITARKRRSALWRLCVNTPAERSLLLGKQIQPDEGVHAAILMSSGFGKDIHHDYTANDKRHADHSRGIKLLPLKHSGNARDQDDASA